MINEQMTRDAPLKAHLSAHEHGVLEIISTDHTGRVRITRYEDDDGQPWWEIEVRGFVHGSAYSGSNHDVHFTGLDAFIADFDAFVLDRSKPAELTGTYDSRLRFHRDASGVWVEFALGDAGTFGQRFTLSGAFAFAEDDLPALQAGFKALARR